MRDGKLTAQERVTSITLDAGAERVNHMSSHVIARGTVVLLGSEAIL